MHDEQEPLHEGPPAPRPAPLPAPLRNWQVLEVDSQATPVIEPDDANDRAPEERAHAAGAPVPQPAAGRSEELRDLQITDRSDEVIVATLDNRRRQVACGGAVEYAVSVLNLSLIHI